MPTGKPIQADWDNIKLYVTSGATLREAASKYGVSETVVRKRANREGWPTPLAIKAKIAELKSKLDAPKEQVTVVTPSIQRPDITEVIADSWVDRAEKHKLLAFNLAHGALKGAKVPQIRHWGDIDTADKMARRAAGLDSTEKNTVNIGLTLVNQRLSAIPSPPQEVTLDLE